MFSGSTVVLVPKFDDKVAFDFAVTPRLISQGLTWAVTLGFFGGFFPALRAARLPITVALRGE